MSKSLRLSVAALSALLALPASAVQRTFVASYGSDANPCTFASPCRGFAAAMSATDPGGEIIVLDSAGYGAVTITQSVSIIAHDGLYAGTSVFAGDGITVSAGPADKVILRGLTINGQGGNRGIVVTSGRNVYIEKCVVSGMNQQGIYVSGATTLSIEDSTLRGNALGGVTLTGTGVAAMISRTTIENNGGTGVTILNGPKVAVSDSRVVGNSGFGGLRARSDDGASTTILSVSRSEVSHNATQAFVAETNLAGSVVTLTATGNTIIRNGATGAVVAGTTGSATGVFSGNMFAENYGQGGLLASGAAATITVSDHTVVGNHNYGFIQASTALFRTRSNNVVEDNVTAATSGTITPTAGQ